MTRAAQIALNAAKLRNTCGRFAARRLAGRAGCLGLYRLACQLLAMGGL